MIVAKIMNIAVVKYDITIKNTIAAIHTKAEEIKRRVLVTTVAWAKVCLMARYRSPLIKSKWESVANVNIIKQRVNANSMSQNSCKLFPCKRKIVLVM